MIRTKGKDSIWFVKTIIISLVLESVYFHIRSNIFVAFFDKAKHTKYIKGIFPLYGNAYRESLAACFDAK